MCSEIYEGTPLFKLHEFESSSPPLLDSSLFNLISKKNDLNPTKINDKIYKRKAWNFDYEIKEENYINFCKAQECNNNQEERTPLSRLENYESKKIIPFKQSFQRRGKEDDVETLSIINNEIQTSEDIDLKSTNPAMKDKKFKSNFESNITKNLPVMCEKHSKMNAMNLYPIKENESISLKIESIDSPNQKETKGEQNRLVSEKGLHFDDIKLSPSSQLDLTSFSQHLNRTKSSHFEGSPYPFENPAQEGTKRILSNLNTNQTNINNSDKNIDANNIECKDHLLQNCLYLFDL